ncbi:MAG TPA: Gfo/Idh/MocA family oxidoreductase [Candidatus Paceibacterota bacterium]
MENKLKVAMIGIGRWGKILLGELGTQAEVKYECDSKTDLVTVFSDPEVQAVFIATPTNTHFDIASKALEADKHVFLEKPGTTDSNDLEKLVRKAEEKNLKLAIGYEFPHHSAAKKLRELLKSKKMKNMFFEWHKWGTFNDDAVMHLLCHEISIAKSLGIELVPVSCKYTKVISNSDILETAFKHDIKSVINRASPIKQKTLTVLTLEGGYIWNNDDLFEINTETRVLDKIDLPETTPVAEEISDFLSAIKENREPKTDGQFALEIYKIIEKVSALR